MSGKGTVFLSIALLIGSMNIAVIAEPSSSNAVGKQSRPQSWPVMTEDEQNVAIDTLKTFADDAGERANVSLAMKQTPFFLFYSDLPDDVAARSIKLLDETYSNLSRLLSIPRNENIWRGKAVVFVFSKRGHFRRFEKKVHNTNPGQAAGMCHCLDDGDVHIAIYHAEDEKEFAHVLVHETVHGFLHRLKTAAAVPSWIDEGLAEAVACELAPQEGRAVQTIDYARRGVALNNGLGGLFDAEQIERWQYPIAQIMTEFLMRRDKEAFAAFILDIKAGGAWERALNDRFHLKRDELVGEFEKIIEAKDAKPIEASKP